MGAVGGIACPAYAFSLLSVVFVVALICFVSAFVFAVIVICFKTDRRESELFWWSNFCRLELCWKMVGGQAARLLSERHFGLYWLCNCWQMW